MVLMPWAQLVFSIMGLCDVDLKNKHDVDLFI